MPIYMEYEGIEGDVTAEGWEKKIELFSLQFGVGRGIGAPTGNTADREASAPSVSEVVVTKNLDKSSGPLFIEAVKGEGKTATISVTKTDADKLEPFVTYVLTETLVSGYSVSSGGDRPTESISLNFTKIELKFVGMTSSNATGDPFNTGYDIGKAKVI